MNILIDNGSLSIFDEKFFQSIIDILEEYLEFNPNAELSIVLTNDADIREINLNYRGIDKATDVLSFPMEEELLLGDIVISTETVEREAAEREITQEREVAFLFIHGFLHLLGYDHETSLEDEKEMFDLQEKLLKIWAEKYGK